MSHTVFHTDFFPLATDALFDGDCNSYHGSATLRIAQYTASDSLKTDVGDIFAGILFGFAQVLSEEARCWWKLSAATRSFLSGGQFRGTVSAFTEDWWLWGEEGYLPSTRTSPKRQLLQLLTLYYWLIWGLLSLRWHGEKDVTAQINTYCLAIDVSATLNNNSCVNNHPGVVQDTNYWKHTPLLQQPIQENCGLLMQTWRGGCTFSSCLCCFGSRQANSSWLTVSCKWFPSCIRWNPCLCPANRRFTKQTRLHTTCATASWIKQL